MGIRCLFGHDFGEPQTSREREERGDEVVVTVKEYKECTRCGRRRLLSENTEVTSATTTEDATATEDSSTDAGADRTTGRSDYEDLSAEEDDGVILEEDSEPTEEDAGRQHGEWPDRDGAPEDTAAETAPSAGTDDADPEPDPDDEPSVETGEWPDAPGEDEGYSAEPGGSGPAEGVEFGGGLTPERAEEGDDSTPDTEYVGRTEPEPPTAGATGIEAAGPSRSPTDPAPDDVATDLVCARCGHLVRDRADSFRPGDVCPECRSGYLAEQPAEE